MQQHPTQAQAQEQALGAMLTPLHACMHAGGPGDKGFISLLSPDVLESKLIPSIMAPHGGCSGARQACRALCTPSYLHIKQLLRVPGGSRAAAALLERCPALEQLSTRYGARADAAAAEEAAAVEGGAACVLRRVRMLAPQRLVRLRLEFSEPGAATAAVCGELADLCSGLPLLRDVEIVGCSPGCAGLAFIHDGGGLPPLLGRLVLSHTLRAPSHGLGTLSPALGRLISLRDLEVGVISRWKRPPAKHPGQWPEGQDDPPGPGGVPIAIKIAELSQLSGLQRLALSVSHIGPGVVPALASALAGMRGLRALSLDGCALSGVELLLPAVAEMAELRLLDLSTCVVREAQQAALTAALRRLRKLRVLRLAERANVLCAEAAAALPATLELLDFSGLGPEARGALALLPELRVAVTAGLPEEGWAFGHKLSLLEIRGGFSLKHISAAAPALPGVAGLCRLRVLSDYLDEREVASLLSGWRKVGPMVFELGESDGQEAERVARLQRGELKDLVGL